MLALGFKKVESSQQGPQMMVRNAHFQVGAAIRLVVGVGEEGAPDAGAAFGIGSCDR